MSEFGKRSRQDRNHSNDVKNQRRKQGNRDDSADGELVIYRILCPNFVIGSVIGKGGKVINSIRQDTNANIKVVDPFPSTDKRVILIYCYVKDKDIDVNEESSEPLCAAQSALLKVHAAIVDALANSCDSDRKDEEEANLLAPTSQVANIIGKAGATIKRLRSTTQANIKVNPKDPNDATHSCAMSFDNFVQITGDAEEVERALFAISAIMYKFSPKENISLDTSVQEQLPPTVIIPSDFPMYSAGSIFHHPEAIIAPSGSLAPTATPHGYTDTSSWPAYSSSFPVVSGYGGTSRSEELVIRVLCPSDQIGRVIGKGGSTIKSIRQSSGAQIDVDDKKDNNDECIITITSTESSEDAKSAALEAVLLLQGKINDEDDDSVSMRLLVPSKSIGCLIGRNGSIVNDMRKKTKADIRISKGEKPQRASSSDELVEVVGEVEKIRDALVQIILRLKKHALGDKDDDVPQVDTLYTSNVHVPPVLPRIPPVAPFRYDQRSDAESGFGMLPGSSLYGYGSLQAGDGGYGPYSSYSSKIYGGLPSYIEVLIPANAIGIVMGKGGANINNIQKISGAHIEIVDSKSSRYERIAQISGTPEQKRSAEDLIQAFIMAT